ncbi:Sec-independent protein translocase protein TatB [Niveibacterium sp. COAC-50]|uniref:Sec-independent protein translocase protein TatB n=1 Tax=Niveibacterium sp. COAC-50 TaxID=2729384 RepID=UPI0015563FF2|nr:Sec-independent protein translocase protein TatB [Niveibacterium sp. COAC-50]
MFDVGFSELMVIGLVALVVIGPEKLPRVARTIGHLLGRMQRHVAEVKADISREIQLDEMRRLQSQVVESAREVESSIREQAREFEESMRPVAAEVESAVATGVSEVTAPQVEQLSELAPVQVAKAEAATEAPLVESTAEEPTHNDSQLDLFGQPAAGDLTRR